MEFCHADMEEHLPPDPYVYASTTYRGGLSAVTAVTALELPWTRGRKKGYLSTYYVLLETG